MIVQPPRGTPVLFYPAGFKSKDNEMAAIVDSSNSQGMVTLTVFNRGSLSYRDSVWHITSDNLTKHPHLKAQKGVWDYHPWFTPPQSASSEPEPSPQTAVMQPAAEEADNDPSSGRTRKSSAAKA